MLRHQGWQNYLAAFTTLALLAGTNPAIATLVIHFDPNDTRATFQNGFEDNRDGTVPATQLGHQVGWIMDTRVPSLPTPDPDNGLDGFVDAQQGNFPNKPLLGYHPHGFVLDFLDSGNNDSLLIFRNNTQKADGFLTNADLNFGTLIVAGRVDPAGTGNSYLFDFRDDSPIGGGVDANDGFAIRYNHATQMMEGIAKQAVNTSVSVPAGSWFVASYAWNGPSESATLTVQTPFGIASDTGVASSVALNSDRARLGNNAAGNAGLLGQIGEFRYYNDIDDHSAVLSQLATDFLSVAELLVDRDTGNVSINVPGSASSLTNVVGYSITSANNTLNSANWLSIADHYDAGNPGPNQVDPDNQWTKLSSSTSVDELSEFEFQGNGGTNAGADFLAGTSTNLGNVWRRYYNEDLAIEVALSNNSVIQLPVRFTGNNGLPFLFGDLNYDGEIDEDDLLEVLKPNYGADTSALAIGPSRYNLGDMNQDGAITLVDFLLLNEAYIAANPGAGSLSWNKTQVPEPSSWVIILFGCALLSGRRISRCLTITAVLLLSFFLLAPQQSYAAIGGVLDVSFEHLTPGGTISDTSRIQDYSGNRYHGFWAGGTAANNTPVDQYFGKVIVNNENNDGYVILRPNLADGGTGSPNAWWGVGNTPQPYFTLGATTSYTFEAILNWNGNNQAIDGIMGFTNTVSEWWIRENNGFLEYVFDDGPNRYVNTGTININSLIDNSDWHHFGMTFARDSITPSNVVITSYIDYQEVHQVAVPVELGAIVPGATQDLRLGSYNGTAGQRFDGLQAHYRISDEVLGVGQFLALPPTPYLEVNTTDGMVKLVNNTTGSFSMDAYRITSEMSSLSNALWTSLQSQDYEGQGPNSGWAELGTSANELSEGLLGGSSTIGPSTTISLGKIYTNLGNEDSTLKFEYHVPGTSATSFATFGIQFFAGPGGIEGDYNGDGVVNAADYALWRDTLNSMTNLAADGNGNNIVDAGDYTFWKERFGNTAGSGAGQASAVPEPASWILLLGIAVGAIVSRGRAVCRLFALALGCFGIAVSTARADAFVDRQYTLGDDSFEGAFANNIVSFTYDSAGVNLAAFPGAINTGAYQDLVVAGAPIYVDVSPSGLKRPGAGVTDLGISFNGTTDRLSTIASLNWPNATWRTEALFPKGSDALYDPPSATGTDGTGDGEYRPAFPHSYAGINQRAMQAWVRPDVAGLDGARQDIIIDTIEHGIFISANNTWGFQYRNASIDTGVLVTDTLNADGWAHVMALGGISTTQGTNTTLGGALLINGQVVASSNAAYVAATTVLSIGSNQAGNNNFFQGTLDDIEMLVWGDNSWRGPGVSNQSLGYLGGANWGTLEAGDNQWIALQLAAAAQAASVPFIPGADVNLDGIVSGNGTGSIATDDVSAFIHHYGFKNEVGAIPVGDWMSRQSGDLNFDGVTDIHDAILLRDALLASGSGSFDFSLLGGASVPEPSTLVLAVGMAGIGIFVRRRLR